MSNVELWQEYRAATWELQNRARLVDTTLANFKAIPHGINQDNVVEAMRRYHAAWVDHEQVKGKLRRHTIGGDE